MKALLFTLVLLTPLLACAEQLALRRVILVVGANDGGAGRVQLRYANSDARAVASVLRDLGGVRADDVLVVEDASVQALRDGLSDLSARSRAVRGQAGRVELVFYYSGHSDEQGLLLSNGRVDYPELRRAIGALPGDVRIAIVDSCSSGALTRAKGGVRRAPFLVDTSTRVTGHAFLTSSSADEVAQESDAVQGSFFTHYLVSGLRGAADVSRDGQVTLNEAYRYAYDETLARTERTRGGPQHAAYDIQLAGTGDLVMTDVRGTSARLRLAADLQGRFFIRDDAGRLVAELRKGPGRPLELGLGPGRYAVTADLTEHLMGAQVVLRKGRLTTLERTSLAPVDSEVATARGPAPHPEPDAAVVVVEDAAAGEVEVVPFNAAVWPRLSRNGDRRPVLNHFALNLLMGDGDVLHGAELALGINTRDAYALGLQMAVTANLVAGEVDGVQMSGGFNHAGAGFRGMQLTGGVNLAGAHSAGLQQGLVNLADGLSGVQMGLVNVGGDVRGVQLGLINIAEDADASFGLLNIVREGLHRFSVTTSDLNVVEAGLRLGGRYGYTLVTAGVGPATDPVRWSAGLGFGGHLPLTDWLFLAADVSGHYLVEGSDFTGRPNVLSRLRVMVGFRFAEHLAVVVGATGNALLQFDGAPFEGLGYGAQRTVRQDPDLEVSVWPGFFAGIEI